MPEYFNFWVDFPDGYWGRSGFLRKWWRIYRNDPRWTPPAWNQLRRMLLLEQHPHLERCNPRFITVEALPRRRQDPKARNQTFQVFNNGVLMEEPVAAGLVLTDPRRSDATAYLSLLHVANSREALERLLYAAQEQAERQGVRRLILPVGLSPYLDTGVLQDHFHRIPPQHAPYAPPYVPELFSTVCRPVGRSLLFSYEPQRKPASQEAGTQDHPLSARGPARISRLDPGRLATDLHPLFAQTTPQWADFPAPDEPEVSFILSWLARRPVFAWLAEVDGTPAGFLLAQADGNQALHRSRGGRSLVNRVRLYLLERRTPRSVRVLFLGVHPDFRRQGIGSQLWRRLLAAGPSSGWESIAVGPVPTTAGAGLSFLNAQGAASRETYFLHRYEF